MSALSVASMKRERSPSPEREDLEREDLEREDLEREDLPYYSYYSPATPPYSPSTPNRELSPFSDAEDLPEADEEPATPNNADFEYDYAYDYFSAWRTPEPMTPEEFEYDSNALHTPEPMTPEFTPTPTAPRKRRFTEADLELAIEAKHTRYAYEGYDSDNDHILAYDIDENCYVVIKAF